MRQEIYRTIFVFLCTLLISSCCKRLDVYPPDNYKGDGKIIFIDTSDPRYAPGWLIKFDDFSLSNEFKNTYSFAGLPGVENQKSYTPYLYTSPSANDSEFDQANLEMTLFADGKQISTYNASMKDWIFTDPYPRDSAENAPGTKDKNFYCLGVSIPYRPEVHYNLQVHYTPPKSIDIDRKGHFYIIMAGGK